MLRILCVCAFNFSTVLLCSYICCMHFFAHVTLKKLDEGNMEGFLTIINYFNIHFSALRYGDLEMFLCGLELTHLLPTFQVIL